MTTPEPPAPQAAGNPAPLADWGTRALGFLIDVAPILILELIAIGSWPLRSIFGLVGTAYAAYLGYLEGITGQTPGKAIMGIKLVNAQGEVIGSGAGIGRKFVHILDVIVCGLGYLLPIVDAQRQTLADKVMTTYVVSGLDKKPFAVELWTPPKA